ncbi:MAG: DUF11 domain-containing protein, partial [Saprospiraceae bacterium]|nr:DUF11 domain-containing protein [Saprospiraceae bacterium]
MGTTFNIEDFFPTDGDGTRSQFWKGSPRDVLNTPDNIVNDDDRYVIRITARMDDEDESGGAADDVPVLENINGTVTGNRLQYQWRKSDNTQFTRNLVADVEIVEPVLALNKAVTATDGNGTISGGNLSNALPGDEVTFTLTLANNGTAPAYEVSLTDNFDAVFDLTSVSVTSGVDNSDLTNDVASVSIASIPAGGSVTVTAVALIRNSAAGGVTYTNTASASGKSQPGNGADIRAYSATGQASVSIIDCQVTISLVEVFAEVCPGANDGSIVVTAGTNTGHPLTYQISGPVAMSNNNGVFSNLPDGVYTVTVSNDGVIGCEATQMNVVVAPGVDNTPPMANCVSGVVTIQLDEFGAATLLATDLDAGSTDNCSQTLNFAFPDGSTQIAFDCGDVNTTSFLAIAVYDATGNQGACFSEVLVQDLLPPDAHCQDITISLGASGTATFSSNMIDNGSSDNCGSVNVQANNLILTCQDLGSFEATFTATDFAGNSSMCTATVTVVDDSPPVLSCQDITVGLDENGQAMLFSALLVVGVTENCGLVGDGSSVTPNMVTCAQAGQVVQVVVQEHDESGNPGTCTANVTVTDPLAPTFIDCPGDLTFDSQDGQCGAFVEYSTPSATDNCNDPAVIQTAGISNPGFFPVGVTTQTYTATDAAGNSTVCSFTITIVD